jgi:hypothetical protein
MVSEISVHYGTEGLAEHRSSVYGGQEAERGMPSLAGFLPLPHLFLRAPSLWDSDASIQCASSPLS